MSIQRHFILFILSLLVITPSIAHQKPYVINFARDSIMLQTRTGPLDKMRKELLTLEMTSDCLNLTV